VRIDRQNRQPTHGRQYEQQPGQRPDSADADGGWARCTARYTFTRTGRPVVNRIRGMFAFRDGLIQKQGMVKIFWEEIEDHKRETYQGLSDSEMEQLLAPDEVEVLAHSAEEGTLAQIDPATGLETVTPATLHDLVVRRKKTTGQRIRPHVRAPTARAAIHEPCQSERMRGA